MPAQLPEHGVPSRNRSEVVPVRIVERRASSCFTQVREAVPPRGALKLPKEAVDCAERELDGTGPRARPVGYPD